VVTGRDVAVEVGTGVVVDDEDDEDEELVPDSTVVTGDGEARLAGPVAQEDRAMTSAARPVAADAALLRWTERGMGTTPTAWACRATRPGRR
jgi:hypothetical protein